MGVRINIKIHGRLFEDQISLSTREKENGSIPLMVNC
jgi:hypothetical protein